MADEIIDSIDWKCRAQEYLGDVCPLVYCRVQLDYSSENVWIFTVTGQSTIWAKFKKWSV